MNQNNQYQQYGYDHYDQAPGAGGPRKKGFIERVLGQRISMKFKNPLFATAALLLVCSAFAAVIIMSYPDDSAKNEDVPVIKAETTAFKETPDEPGGADIPFRDSTVFTAMRDGELEESAPVENLLEREEPVDRFATFAEEAEKALEMDITEDVGGEEAAQDGDEQIAEEAPVKPIEIKKIAQETEKISGQEIAEAQAQTQAEQQRRPQKLHAPGSSPETLAFVRSVLDKKDSKKTRSAPSDNVDAAPAVTTTATASTPAELASIEPSTGAATGADIQPGGYFVQLASVTSASGAENEWGKLRKTYSAELQNASHRVQQADLGERGTYYRIQAGPMSKDSANRICDAIKARKPGGCLVVK